MIGIVVSTWPKNDPVLIVCSLFVVAAFAVMCYYARRK